MMVFRQTEGNRVLVELSELVFKSFDMQQGMDLVAGFCKL